MNVLKHSIVLSRQVRLYVIGFEPTSFRSVGPPERERLIAGSDGVFLAECLVPLRHTFFSEDYGALNVVGHEHDGKILVCETVMVPA